MKIREVIHELENQGRFLSRQRGSHTVENMREAIEFHLEGMDLHGDELAKQMPIVKTVRVAS